MVGAPELARQHCRDILPALLWLNRSSSDDGLLQVLTWKERLPVSAQQRLPAQQWVYVSQSSWTSRSPWAGLPGCVFWTDARTEEKVAQKGSSARDRFCQSHAQRQAALPSLPGQSQLLTRLAPWRIPQHPLYERLVGDRNRLELRGGEHAMGLYVQLTLDPNWQAQAQQLAECYSGLLNSPDCVRQALDQDYYERARVRLAGITVLDVPSAKVLVAASASSPCHVFDHTRMGPVPQGCPTVDPGTVHRPQVPQDLTNHALFTQAPPGSLVKPIMMAGILAQPAASSSVSGIEVALQRSDSQRFLDAFLCRQRLGSGDFQPGCPRPRSALDAAHSLGWNTGCDGREGRALSQCGKLDLLHGVALADRPEGMDEKWINAGLFQPIQWPTLMGQFLVSVVPNPDGGTWMADMDLDAKRLDPQAFARCARSGKTGYSRCQGSGLGVISEAYGQGNARATPVGVAGVLAALASSAQATAPRYPHVLGGVWLGDGSADAAMLRPQRQGIAQGPKGLPVDISQRILAAMETTHMPGGTAHAACVKAMGASACQGRLGIAGKTGTPGDVDERSLAQLHASHLALLACKRSARSGCEQTYPPARARYRWYAALFKSEGSEQYDKAIAVLVHSNWRRSDGRFSDDNSAAAELAFRFIQTVRTPTIPKASGQAPAPVSVKPPRSAP